MVKVLTIGLIFVSFSSFATTKESNFRDKVLKILNPALYKKREIEREEKRKFDQVSSNLYTIIADYKRQLNKTKENYDEAMKDQLDKKCQGLTSVFMKDGSIPRHARKKQTLFVIDSLFEIAKDANKKLSSYIGITLFEIKSYKEYKGKGGKIYTADKVDHDRVLGVARGVSSNGEIFKTDIVLKKEHYKADSYQIILNTMMHEMGHALGLDHTTKDIKNLMYPYNLLQQQKDRNFVINSNRLNLTNKQISAVRCAFSLKSHNNAFEHYNKAIDNYNKAVKEYNKVVKDYNDKIKDLYQIREKASL